MLEARSWEKWLRIRETRIQIDALEIAPDLPDVRRWRAEAFEDRDGRLLGSDEMEAWVERFEDPDSFPDLRDEEVRLRFFAELQTPKKRRWIESSRTGSAGRWAPPSGEGFEVKPIPGSVLDQGFEIAEALATRFGWTEKSAARWLLTGNPPAASPIATIHPKLGERETNQPWREIELRIPVEIPAGAVAELYQTLREQALSGFDDVPLVENTPMSEKNLKATVFAVERSQTGAAWGDVLEEWTKYAKSKRKGKDWGFQSTQAFIAATRKTYERLTGRNLQWKRKRGERK